MIDTIIDLLLLLGSISIADKPPAGGIPIPPRTTGAGSLQ